MMIVSMAGRLRPCLGDTPKRPPNGTLQRAKSGSVSGQRRKPPKMFPVGIYCSTETFGSALQSKKCAACVQ